MHGPEANADFQKSHPPEPFSIGEGHSRAGFRYGIKYLKWGGYYELAYNPKSVDGRFFEDFCKRWTTYFAQAAMREMPSPLPLPEEEIEDKFRH